MELEQRKSRFNNKISKFWKDNHNKIFIAIFILAVIIRFYYFAYNFDQPLWWDEAAYGLEAKHFAFDTPSTGFHAGRPILETLIQIPLLKIGLGEVFFRFLRVLFSLAVIPLIYYVGNKVFNKKVGLIASFIFAVFWVDLFYLPRFLPDLLGLLFFMLFLAVFYKSKENEKWFKWLGPIFIFAYMAREQNVLLLPIFGLYFLTTEKLKFFKQKKFWMAVLMLLIFSIPYFSFNYVEFGDPLANLKWRFEKLSVSGPITPEGGERDPVGLFIYMKRITHPVILPLLIFVLGGIGIMLFNILFGLDLIWKNKNEKLKNYYLFFCILFVNFIFFDIVTRIFDERYITMTYPILFFLSGNFIDWGRINISKESKNKMFGWIFVLIVLGFIAVPNLQKADALIISKVDSYWQVKQAGEYIRENSEKDAVVFGTSVPQLVYYSEREAVQFPENKSEFNIMIEKEADYMFVSAFEYHPSWINSWLEENPGKLEAVQAYGQTPQDKNIVAVLYKFKWQE